MLIVSICQEMGWDYYTYMNQPNWFLELIINKIVIDNKKLNEEIKK